MEEGILKDIWSEIPNEVICSKKKKYIFGISIDSLCVFLMSLNGKVYIKGFISDNHNLDTVFNKKVVKLDEVPNDVDILVPESLMDCYKSKHTKREFEIYKIYVHKFAAPIRENAVYIWGAGNNGINTLKLLTNYKIKVKGFIDSDKKKNGKIINGISVYSPDFIEKDDIIIISSRYYKQISSSLSTEKFKNIFVDYGTIYCVDYPYVVFENDKDVTEDIVWNIYHHFFVLMRDVINKKIVIYGYNKLGKELEKVLSLMDSPPIYYIEDSEIDTGSAIVKNKFDILYDEIDEVMILVSKFRENNKTLVCDSLFELENMGLKYNKSFKNMKEISDNSIRDERVSNYGCRFEPMLGYTLLYPETSVKYPQYIVLGDENPQALKIMILGGSTSDIGQYKPEKSWVEFLWEKLDKKVTIWGGGIGGYNSRQECFKLLRDIGTIKPDIVISYSGVNDVYPLVVEGHPFVHKYQEECMKYASNSFPVDPGIIINENNAELWLRMEVSMCAIAESFGSKFYGIFQPAIYNKEVLVGKENEIVVYENDYYNDNAFFLSYADKKKRYEQILHESVESEKFFKNNFLYDFSDLFRANKSEIFKDCIHLYECGNELVAEKVFEIIVQDIYRGRYK